MFLTKSERAEKRKEIIRNFKSSENGLFHKGIFGLPFGTEESELVIIPVPWDATTSYRAGTSAAPQTILEASHQIDLYHPLYGDLWKEGISIEPVNEDIILQNNQLRTVTSNLLNELDQKPSSLVLIEKKEDYLYINSACEALIPLLAAKSSMYLLQKKLVGFLGGDHSISLGLIKALGDYYPDFTVLQIDAHADLRKSYEGFDYSHASAMYNTMKIPAVKKIIQLGIRDYCAEEADLTASEGNRIITYTWPELFKKLACGNNWKTIADEIISHTGNNIYISFDIDGMDPSLCPNTGTPVPGGFLFDQIQFLLYSISSAGKKVIGFDLCEVGYNNNTDWDANVGMRVLYELSCLTLATHFKQLTTDN